MKKKLGFLILIIMAVLFTRNISAGSWSVQESGTTTGLLSVCFVDASNGWIAGKEGLILHTSNGGIIWEVQESKIQDNYLHSVFFIDQNKGWVGGERVIFYTMDGGKNWNSVNLIAELCNICFVDQNNGWASGLGGKGGIIFHTNNSGKTWATQTTIAETSYFGLPGVHFINSTTGWVVGGGGVILHTKNGGKTWGTQTSGTDVWLLNVYFADSNNGWVVGYPNTILHTTDGGKTWGTQTNPGVDFLTRIHFIDSSTGWIAGGGGKILYTTNGGNVWNIQDSGTTTDLYSVYFIDANNGWAVGYNGTILKYSELPAKTKNVTVYPNPCNPEYKQVIFGHLTDPDKKLTRQSTIKIYNIAGEWVRTIEESDGNGMAIWDMTNNEGKKVASGIYVYCVSIPEGQRYTGRIGVIR